MATLFEKLTAAGLPIQSATEAGEISGLPDIQMTEAQRQTFSDIVLEHFNPSEYQALLAMRADKQQVKAEYTATINTLQQIESTAAPTNAQVITAIRFLAKTIRLMLRILARALTD